MTHQAVAAGPVHLVVDADAGLACLQGVGEAADLQHQQVDRLQHLLAVDHAVGQALQLAVAHGPREGAREADTSTRVSESNRKIVKDGEKIHTTVLFY